MIYRSLECGCEAHIYEDGSTPNWDMFFCDKHSGDPARMMKGMDRGQVQDVQHECLVALEEV